MQPRCSFALACTAALAMACTSAVAAAGQTGNTTANPAMINATTTEAVVPVRGTVAATGTAPACSGEACTKQLVAAAMACSGIRDASVCTSDASCGWRKLSG